MINLCEIKELSTHGARAKPVIASINENGCWQIISHAPSPKGYILQNALNTALEFVKLAERSTWGRKFNKDS